MNIFEYTGYYLLINLDNMSLGTSIQIFHTICICLQDI